MAKNIVVRRVFQKQNIKYCLVWTVPSTQHNAFDEQSNITPRGADLSMRAEVGGHTIILKEQVLRPLIIPRDTRVYHSGVVLSQRREGI